MAVRGWNGPLGAVGNGGEGGGGGLGSRFGPKCCMLSCWEGLRAKGPFFAPPSPQKRGFWVFFFLPLGMGAFPQNEAFSPQPLGGPQFGSFSLHLGGFSSTFGFFFPPPKLRMGGFEGKMVVFGSN